MRLTERQQAKLAISISLEIDAGGGSGAQSKYATGDVDDPIVGLRVLRRFPGFGDFWGTVAGTRDLDGGNRKWFRVEYDDGDSEEYNLKDIQRIADNASSKSGQDPQGSTSATARAAYRALATLFSAASSSSRAPRPLKTSESNAEDDNEDSDEGDCKYGESKCGQEGSRGLGSQTGKPGWSSHHEPLMDLGGLAGSKHAGSGPNSYALRKLEVELLDMGFPALAVKDGLALHGQSKRSCLDYLLSLHALDKVPSASATKKSKKSTSSQRNAASELDPATEAAIAAIMADDEPEIFPCHTCRTDTPPESLLLCDGTGCNTEVCLKCARLSTVPADSWFCTQCLRKKHLKGLHKRASIPMTDVTEVRPSTPPIPPIQNSIEESPATKEEHKPSNRTKKNKCSVTSDNTAAVTKPKSVGLSVDVTVKAEKPSCEGIPRDAGKFIPCTVSPDLSETSLSSNLVQSPRVHDEVDIASIGSVLNADKTNKALASFEQHKPAPISMPMVRDELASTPFPVVPETFDKCDKQPLAIGTSRSRSPDPHPIVELETIDFINFNWDVVDEASSEKDNTTISRKLDNADARLAGLMAALSETVSRTLRRLNTMGFVRTSEIEDTALAALALFPEQKALDLLERVAKAGTRLENPSDAPEGQHPGSLLLNTLVTTVVSLGGASFSDSLHHRHPDRSQEDRGIIGEVEESERDIYRGGRINDAWRARGRVGGWKESSGRDSRGRNHRSGEFEHFHRDDKYPRREFDQKAREYRRSRSRSRSRPRSRSRSRSPIGGKKGAIGGNVTKYSQHGDRLNGQRGRVESGSVECVRSASSIAPGAVSTNLQECQVEVVPADKSARIRAILDRLRAMPPPPARDVVCISQYNQSQAHGDFTTPPEVSRVFSTSSLCLCRSWNGKEGSCRYGAECKFSHVNYPRTVCRHFAINGSCRFNSDCRLQHLSAEQVMNLQASVSLIQ